MALSENCLTTLSAVKDELRIAQDDTSYDSVLERYIESVSASFETLCDRKFHYGADIVEKVAGYGTTLVVLSRRPVLSVASVVVDGSPVTDYTVHDVEAGLLHRASGWPWTASTQASVTYHQVPGTEERSIVVTYTGGYVTPVQATAQLPRTLPYDLEQLCIDGVVALFRDRGVNKAMKSEKLQGMMSAEFERGAFGLPLSVIEALKRWG